MKTFRLTSMLLSLAFALPVIAQAQMPAAGKENYPPAATQKTMKKMTTKPVDAVCMQTAVGKRDTAIIAGVDAYASGAKAAISSRLDALKAAWGNPDIKARRVAVQGAWRVYDSAAKNARMAFKKARNDAWDQFRNDRSSCGPGAAAMDSATGAADGLL